MRDDEIPRPVKPRKLQDANLPIIVVHRDSVFVERTGELMNVDRLPVLVATEPSSLFVIHSAGSILHGLHERYKDHPQWQYKLTPIHRKTNPNPGKSKTRIVVKDVVVNFFGFSRKGKGKSKYHYPLDPLLFVRMSAPEIRGRDEDTMTALYEWGKDVRKFAVDNQMKVSPTSGGMAAQLLRDPRFYPDDRRKVPAATNVRARVVLPGNFYRLKVETDRFYRAVYLDQKSAHHNCAKDLEFPHADRLFAKGYFAGNGCNGCNGLWSHAGTQHFKKIIRQPGLFHLRLRVPYIREGVTVPPYMEKTGEHDAWVYSNELPMIAELGGKILGLYAAWTSTKTDKGLNRYAEWALEQIQDADEKTRPWLKPTLLAPYGILAAKPRRMEFAFYRAKSGEDKLLPVGGAMLPVKSKKTAGEFEPGFANVIHRGMIEAETRKRTIELANQLNAAGVEVIAVYADSVFARRNAPLPLLPAGWSVKSDLDGLRFLNDVSFTSKQLVRLPGVPREIQDKYLGSRIPARL